MTFLDWLDSVIVKVMSAIYKSNPSTTMDSINLQNDPSLTPPAPPENTSVPVTTDPSTPVEQPRTADHSDTPADLRMKMCLAIKEYEGWACPGATLNGVYYPNGTTSYRFNNPGNLNYAMQPFAVPGISGAHVFAKFDTPEHGFAALMRQVSIVAAGTSKGFSAAALKKFGLYGCQNLTLVQFFSIYAPSNDGNSPDRYALWVASKMNVDPHTFQMHGLVD